MVHISVYIQVCTIFDDKLDIALLIRRWFQIRVDLLTVFYISVTQFTSIPLAESEKDLLNTFINTLYLGLNPALVALSLAYVVVLTYMFAYTLVLSTEIENLVSCE